MTFLLKKFVFVAASPVIIPLMGITGIAVRLGIGKPILFTQKRDGLNGVPFTMYKFRTMRVAANDNQNAYVLDAERETKTGRILRRLNLDELPQTFNILKGNMNIIGPRAIPESVPEKFQEIHSFKPGLICGRTPIRGLRRILPSQPDYEERLAQGLSEDLNYMKNRTLLSDLKLIFKCAIAPLKYDEANGIQPLETSHDLSQTQEITNNSEPH